MNNYEMCFPQFVTLREKPEIAEKASEWFHSKWFVPMEAYRGRGIAGRLLHMAVEDLRAKGISPVYLITDHTGFYERYGWEFLCMVQGDGEAEQTYTGKIRSGQECMCTGKTRRWEKAG